MEKVSFPQLKLEEPFLEVSRPRVFLINPRRLLEIKKVWASGNPRFKENITDLLQKSNTLIAQEAFTIVHKNHTPPSGDKQDYFSTGQYWWPNPSSLDGLPFIRKDGLANPDSESISDRRTLHNMIQAVSTLGLAYFLTHDEAFSHKAASLLQVFFLDSSTRMNPNLRYAQAIPGRSEGRGTGIIDGTSLIYLVDAVGLLEGSTAWPPERHEALVAWFSEYIDWLLSHQHGKAECSANNNHGTSYDLHVASGALFCGKTQVARNILAHSVEKRIGSQITADGMQPFELSRSKSWDYSTHNLRKFFQLAVLGNQLGIDLWHYKAWKGGSLQRALDFLLPFVKAPSRWPYEQIGTVEPKHLKIPLLFAEIVYGESRYRAALEQLGVYEGKFEDCIYFPNDRGQSDRPTLIS